MKQYTGEEVYYFSSRHCEVDLRDAIEDEESKQPFNELCTQYQDMFSVDLPHIGKTGLVTMDIDTGNSPPVSQKACTLPLKHGAGV